MQEGTTDLGQPALTSAPLLAALKTAGTRHLYADTADVAELRSLIEVRPSILVCEVDGNTANQPLIHKVVARYLPEKKARAWFDLLRARQPELSQKDAIVAIYTLICGQIGNDMAAAFAVGRAWEVSLQLHMSLSNDPEAAMQI